MTEFQRVDKARHRCYRWRCTECNKTFDYGAPRWDKAPNARAVSPVHCPECGACDFVCSAKLQAPATPSIANKTGRLVTYYGECCVCTALTEFACSDCRIDTGRSVYVCNYGACQRAHERTHKETSEDVRPA